MRIDAAYGAQLSGLNYSSARQFYLSSVPNGDSARRIIVEESASSATTNQHSYVVAKVQSAPFPVDRDREFRFKVTGDTEFA